MRPPKDVTFLEIAHAISKQSTCVRRAVGCVLTDKHNHVIGMGYNGVPAGQPHCNEGHPCAGADLPSGQGLEDCEATHAEENAVLQCMRPMDVETIYTTTSPCVHCLKLLLNTPAKRIVFSSEYGQPKAKERWTRAGRIWQHLPVAFGREQTIINITALDSADLAAHKPEIESLVRQTLERNRADIPSIRIGEQS